MQSVRDKAYIGGQPVPNGFSGVFIAHVVFYFILLLGNVALWVIYLIQPGSSKEYDENINALLSWVFALALLAVATVGGGLYAIAVFQSNPDENDKGVSNRPFNYGQTYSVNFFLHLTFLILFGLLWSRSDSISTAETPVDVIANYNARTFALIYLFGISIAVAVQASGVFGFLYAVDSETNSIKWQALGRPARMRR
jgi:hypothetical protein